MTVAVHPENRPPDECPAALTTGDPDAEEHIASEFSETMKLGQASGAASGIFWSKATHGKRPQEQEPRKLSGVEDLNAQVIPRMYSRSDSIQNRSNASRLDQLSSAEMVS
jgi:hypothetical protein